jgi:hypothetical protein
LSIDQQQCESFTARLTKNSLAIFTWIEILEAHLDAEEKFPLRAMMEHIKSFMHLFDIKIPDATLNGTRV